MKSVLVTGDRGQLGAAIARRIPREAFAGFDLPETDVRDAASVREAVRRAAPGLVVHCAAMTDVDGCARDPASALAVNAGGTENVARAARDLGADLVYVGTNEVFDGESDRPYVEDDPVRPVNAYGRSKLEGEAVAMLFQPRCWIVRTAWLYGAGGRNFIHRILGAADEGRSLRVVTDEVSSPTWTEDLAAAILHLAANAPHGVYHAAGLGACSRYELARAAFELTGRGAVVVEPIRSIDWPRDSRPPLRAPLDCSRAVALGAPLRPWREALAAFLAERPALHGP
jgi:dTDP-4-dehydrorhamnose reductase